VDFVGSSKSQALVHNNYIVEFKRYYTALSDMLAVAGFEYICKAGRYVIKIFVLMSKLKSSLKMF
jgi:hypothetical protein